MLFSKLSSQENIILHQLKHKGIARRSQCHCKEDALSNGPQKSEQRGEDRGVYERIGGGVDGASCKVVIPLRRRNGVIGMSSSDGCG